MYIYRYTCKLIGTHIQMYTYSDINLYTYRYTCTHIGTHVNIYIHMYTYKRINVARVKPHVR